LCASDDRLVVNSYLPGVFQVKVAADGSQEFKRIVVEGNYPFEPRCSLRIESQMPEEFAVDFRMPSRATKLEIRVNGQPFEPAKTSAGYYRVRRDWQPNDQIDVAFDFPLRAHFETASDNDRWVAFSWGPLTLAQTIEKQTDHPQNVLVIEKESDDGNKWLQRELSTNGESSVVTDAVEVLDTDRSKASSATVQWPLSWRLKTPRRIILTPYFQAGANGGGVRTMFPTRSDKF
jgi:DUF1680 family protein